MEEVVKACETLADTGNNQLLIVGGAILLVALAVAWLVTGRKLQFKFMVAALGILFGFSLFLVPAATYAQSAPDDCVDAPISANEESVGLGLVDDMSTLALPDADQSIPNTRIYVAILGNDNAPQGDPLDWDTIDLDPDSPGQQTFFSLRHPNNADILCGEVRVSTFGIVSVNLIDPCWNENYDLSLPIPGDYSIDPFTYTAQTQGGDPAPAPATVTITVDPTPDTSIVIAAEDTSTCSFYISETLDILSNDTTSIGTLNPLSIDLNPSLPGRQTSVSLTEDSIVSSASVDNDGIVTLVSDSYSTMPTIYYTVENSEGSVSNIAEIISPNSCE